MSLPWTLMNINTNVLRTGKQLLHIWQQCSHVSIISERNEQNFLLLGILGFLLIITHKGEVKVPEALSTTVIISAVIGGIKWARLSIDVWLLLLVPCVFKRGRRSSKGGSRFVSLVINTKPIWIAKLRVWAPRVIGVYETRPHRKEQD